MSENINIINEVDIEDELKVNFIEYAVAVNTDRAIPDARSGFKPVAKRIVYCSHENGFTSKKPHVKCAEIVGNVMSYYHPHGDSSIYGALVRLACPWALRYPILDFHGNVGSIMGDPPAHYRYTEARLSKLAEKGLLANIKKGNIDFEPNYSETREEPTTLPAIFPNLLCNPNTGIGVAMACSWLPHNLREVAQAIRDFADGKEPMLPGPDFPTGGIVINKNDIPAIMKSGHGSVKVRAKYTVEKNRIIITEIPYGTIIENLMKELGEACDAKEIEGIIEANDCTDKHGVKIIIEFAKGADPDAIMKKVFAKTNFQTSISYNQVALVGKTPTELSLKQCIEIYFNHNEDCIRRELKFDLNKATARLEIVEGLLKALADIDNIITLIKASDNSSAAKTNLMVKYKFTENQAKAIIDLKLGKLAHLEKVEIEDEKKELINTIADINNVLSNPDLVRKEVLTRLQAIVDEFGDNRRTELAQIEVEPEEKEIAEVVPEDVVVIVSQSGEVKRIPAKSFRVQKRNGKGVRNEDDAILETISTNTIDTLMIFTSAGKMYRLLVDKVPEGTNTSKGVRINSLVEFEAGEHIVAVTSLYRQTNAEYVVFITKNGIIKKTPLEEYMKTKRSKGIAAINIKEGDAIANVTFLKDEELLLVTRKGMSIRFATSTITPIGRIAAGVKSIKLDEEDSVVVGLPVHKTTDKLAIFTERGYGKQTALNEFPTQGRSGKGVVIYHPNAVTGDICSAVMLSEEDNVVLIGKPTSICIAAKDVPILARQGMGNILIKDSIVARVVKL